MKSNNNLLQILFFTILFASFVFASKHEEKHTLSYDKVVYYQEGIYSEGKPNSLIEVNITSKSKSDSTLELVVSDYSARRGLGYNDEDSHQIHYCCTPEYEEKGICSEVGSLILSESKSFIKRYSLDLIPNKSTYKQIQINSSDYYFIYFVNCDNETSASSPLSFDSYTQIHNIYGYLPSEYYGKIGFSIAMIVIYCILILLWIFLCLIYCSQVMSVQMWILLVSVICLIENGVCLLSLNKHNENGEVIDSLEIFYLIINSLKRDFSRILMVIVCMGYGVTRTNLEGSRVKLAVIFILYFVLAIIENVLKNSNDSDSISVYIIEFPVILIDIYIYFWFFTSLIDTINKLNEDHQTKKVKLFKNLRRIIILSAIISLIYLCVYMLYVLGDYLYVNWKTLWFVESGFWDCLYLFLIVCIMYLWRPKRNSKQYVQHVQIRGDDKQDDEDYVDNAEQDSASLIRKV